MQLMKKTLYILLICFVFFMQKTVLAQENPLNNHTSVTQMTVRYIHNMVEYGVRAFYQGPFDWHQNKEEGQLYSFQDIYAWFNRTFFQSIFNMPRVNYVANNQNNVIIVYRQNNDYNALPYRVERRNLGHNEQENNYAEPCCYSPSLSGPHINHNANESCGVFSCLFPYCCFCYEIQRND